MDSTPLMSHNVEVAIEQAKHLIKLRIAERAKVDLYYLCHDILGYEAMTTNTHAELCAITSSLLPSYIRANESSNIDDLSSSVAHSTMDDPTNESTHSTPHSHPEDTVADADHYFNHPSPAAKKNIGENSLSNNGLAKQLVSENTGLYKQSIDSQNLDGKLEESDSPPASAASSSAPSAPSSSASPIVDLFPGNEFKQQYDPDKKALHIEMPRGTFKSSVVTIGFALQFILNDRNGRILIDSETYSKAKNFLSEIKGHLESNKKFRDVYFTLYGMYPDSNKKETSVRWTDSMIDLSCRTKQTKEASFMVSGIDKSINGMHFDLIVGDDLHSETNVTNREQIDKVVQHYKLLLSLLDPDRYLIIIGTRWHYNDMYQYLIDYEQFRFNFYVRKARNDDGTLLFPERLHERFLSEQRQSQGSYLFSCQYMNTPVDDEDATFKRSYIITRKWELIEPIPINWYMSVDPSWEGKSSDFAAITIAGLDAMSNLYVRHVTRRKMRYDELITEMFLLYNRYKPKEIAVETIASANSIQYMLAQEMKRRQAPLPLKYISGRNTNKEIRIEALQPYYAYGRAIHVLECPQRDELEDELIAFPKGANDDVIDSLATILEIAKPAKMTRDPEERERRKAQIDKYTKPRSPLTKV